MRRGFRFPAEPGQLDLFVSAGGGIAPLHTRGLLAWPFFSLAAVALTINPTPVRHWLALNRFDIVGRRLPFFPLTNDTAGLCHLPLV